MPTPHRIDVPMKICMFSLRPVARSILKKAGAGDIGKHGRHDHPERSQIRLEVQKNRELQAWAGGGTRWTLVPSDAGRFWWGWHVCRTT